MWNYATSPLSLWLDRISSQFLGLPVSHLQPAVWPLTSGCWLTAGHSCVWLGRSRFQAYNGYYQPNGETNLLTLPLTAYLILFMKFKKCRPFSHGPSGRQKVSIVIQMRQSFQRVSAKCLEVARIIGLAVGKIRRRVRYVSIRTANRLQAISLGLSGWVDDKFWWRWFGRWLGFGVGCRSSMWWFCRYIFQHTRLRFIVYKLHFCHLEAWSTARRTVTKVWSVFILGSLSQILPRDGECSFGVEEWPVHVNSAVVSHLLMPVALLRDAMSTKSWAHQAITNVVIETRAKYNVIQGHILNLRI